MEKKFEYRKWQYYVIIGVISMIAVFFLPMIGSEAGLAWKLPNTVVGWIVYVVSKLLVAGINILLFYCFMEQAKVNVQDDAKFIEANAILLKQLNLKELKPRSPQEWNRKEYGTKGISIFATSILSAIGLTQAILTFDWVSMLTYLFTIIMGVIFGIIQMNKAEDYWTNEYWKYAKMVEREMAVAKEESSKQGDVDIHTDRGADLLEPSYYFDPISLTSKPVVVDNNFSDYCFLGRAVHPSDTTSGRTDIWTKEIAQEIKEMENKQKC